MNKLALERLKAMCERRKLTLMEDKTGIKIGNQLSIGKLVLGRYMPTTEQGDTPEDHKMEKILQKIARFSTFSIAQQRRIPLRLHSAVPEAEKHLRSIGLESPLTMSPNTAWRLINCTGSEGNQKLAKLAGDVMKQLDISEGIILAHTMEFLRLKLDEEEKKRRTTGLLQKFLDKTENVDDFLGKCIDEIRCYKVDHKFTNDISALYHQDKHHHEFVGHFETDANNPEEYHSLVIPGLISNKATQSLSLSQDGLTLNRNWEKKLRDGRVLFLSSFAPFSAFATYLDEEPIASLFNGEHVGTAFIKKY